MGWKDTKAGLVCQGDFIAARFYRSMLCRNRGRFRERNHYPEANSHPRCCNPDLKTVYESSISLPANRHKATLNLDMGFMKLTILEEIYGYEQRFTHLDNGAGPNRKKAFIR